MSQCDADSAINVLKKRVEEKRRINGKEDIIK